MLTDNPNRKHLVRSRRKPMSYKNNKEYSDEQKIELIKMYLLTGNLAFSAASLSIPEITARQWKNTNWWKETEHELRLQQDFEVNAHLSKIVEKSLEVVADRLQGGDYIYDSKIGKMVRRPVSAIQANKIVQDMLDRRDLLDKKTTTGASQEVAIDKFVQLAEKFAQLAQKTTEKPPVEVTDVIYVEEKSDAVHDRREEGLQEGEREILVETGAEEEPGETEQSSEGSDSGWTYA